MSAGNGIDFAHILEILLGASPAAIAAYVAIKVDNGVLKTRMDAVDKQLARMDNVLVSLAETKGQMALHEQRALMEGARVDRLDQGLAEMTKRLNEFIDGRGEK